MPETGINPFSRGRSPVLGDCGCFGKRGRCYGPQRARVAAARAILGSNTLGRFPPESRVAEAAGPEARSGAAVVGKKSAANRADRCERPLGETQAERRTGKKTLKNDPSERVLRGSKKKKCDPSKKLHRAC